MGVKNYPNWLDANWVGSFNKLSLPPTQHSHQFHFLIDKLMFEKKRFSPFSMTVQCGLVRFILLKL
jgi:hypothetical protein